MGMKQVDGGAVVGMVDTEIDTLSGSVGFPGDEGGVNGCTVDGFIPFIADIILLLFSWYSIVFIRESRLILSLSETINISFEIGLNVLCVFEVDS